MISVDKARVLRAAIERAVPALNLSDCEALACAELYPRWAVGKAYKAGDRVREGDRLYRCILAHNSQDDWTPPDTSALWNEVRPHEATGYDEWQRPTGAHNAYNTGDRSVYAGMVYESLIDGNTWSPDEHPAGWRLAD